MLCVFGIARIKWKHNGEITFVGLHFLHPKLVNGSRQSFVLKCASNMRESDFAFYRSNKFLITSLRLKTLLRNKTYRYTNNYY